LSYFEAVNKETLKNAWTRFEEEGIILIAKSRNSKVQPKAKLAPEWESKRNPKNDLLVPEGRLWDFTEKIAQSRREGKNRRDGATVSTRVLRLTDTIGQALYSDSMTDAGMSEEDKALLKKKQKRRQNMQARAHL
jgi:hypothetical protein